MNKKRKIKIDFLLLDPKNPRFAKTIDEAKRDFDYSLDDIKKLQDSRVKEIMKTQNYNVLIESIVRHGYVDLDPIIISSIDETEYFVTIEGNRRVCAINEILSNTAALKLMNKEKIDSLKELNCIILEEKNSEEVNKMLGIRHLVGVQQWDSLQKSLVIAALYQEKQDSKVVGAATGETVTRVNRYLRVVALYNWIIENTEFGEEIKKEATIDIFMVAMSRKNIKEWFGYEENKENFLEPEFRNPENIELFAEWISKKIISTGRFDVNALNKLLTRNDSELYIARIQEGESPQKIEGELSTRRSKWKVYVEGAIKTLTEISLPELEKIDSKDKELLNILSMLIDETIEKNEKLS